MEQGKIRTEDTDYGAIPQSTTTNDTPRASWTPLRTGRASCSRYGANARFHTARITYTYEATP